MVNEQDFVDLNSNFDTGGNCVARVINLLLIPTLIYALVIVGYLGMLPLRVEMHSVILIGFIYIIYLFFVKHNAYYASCQFRKRYVTLKDQLKNYINKNKLTIEHLTKANASADDFLHEFTLDLRNQNFSSVAAGIFPTLGILGTFISIAVSMPDFSSKTSAVLEQEISLLLGGVGTAFYVSIYGIFLSIWWIFYEKIGMSRFDHDVLIIKENTKNLFWNKIDIDKIHFQKSIDNYEKLNAVFNNIGSQELVENLNNSLQQRLEMFDSMIDVESKMMEKSNQHMQKRMEDQDRFEQSYEKITSDMSNLAPMLSKIVNEMNQMMKHMQEKENAVSNTTQIFNENIAMLNESLKNISAQNLEAIYSSIIKNIETMKNDTDKIGWRFNQQLNDFDEKFTSQLHHSLEMIDAQSSEIIEKIAQLKEEEK